MAHVAEHGVSGLTLRGLAHALGTSHRMLIYHFGSKNGLLTAIVQEVEAEQRALLTGLVTDDAEPAEVARRFWRHLAAPAMWPRERLFFELYAQALRGAPGTEPLLDGLVEAWLAPMTAWLERLGLPPRTARARARLGVAVSRGLLLDVLATGDRTAVNAAMDEFIAIFAAALPVGGTVR
jgi:AcrR family transcriptional regulator